MDQSIQDILNTARRLAAGDDPSLAVYILRDIEPIKSTRGTDRDLYALAYHMGQDAGCTREEAFWFIGLVEQAIKEAGE